MTPLSCTCAELLRVPVGRFMVILLSVTVVVIPPFPTTFNVSVLRFKVSPPVDPLKVSVDAILVNPAPSPTNDPVNEPVLTCAELLTAPVGSKLVI